MGMEEIKRIEEDRREKGYVGNKIREMKREILRNK